MNSLSGVRRPVGCLKTAFRRTRFIRSQSRCLSTAPAAAPLGPFSPMARQRAERVSKFRIWPTLPSVKSKYPDPMPALREQQIAKFDPTGARTRLFSKAHKDSAKVGDVLQVTSKAGEPFAGAFIEIRRRGLDTAILLRGQLMKTSVEMWFKIYAPTTRAIDIIWRRPKRARRARLTYMRKPKHDMGSVDHLVFAWKKERYALRSRGKSGGGAKGAKK